MRVPAADMSVPAADMSVPAADMSGPRGWRWENPQPQGNPLFGVWGTGASNVWAVGELGAIQRWNGTAWLAVKSGTTETLRSV